MSRLNLNLSQQWLRPANDQLPSRTSARSARPGRLHNMLRSNTDQTNFMPTGRKNSWRQRQQGQALIEFALVLLFIILPITFVLVDGALTLFTLSNVTNAAREGARAGSIYQTNTSQGTTQTFADYWAQIDDARLAYIRQEVQSRLGPLVASSQCATTVGFGQPPDPNLAPEIGNPFRELDSLTVRVACPRRLLFGLVNASTITLASESTMKIEPGGVQNSP